jgi:hypothetical protein
MEMDDTRAADKQVGNLEPVEETSLPIMVVYEPGSSRRNFLAGLLTAATVGVGWNVLRSLAAPPEPLPGKVTYSFNAKEYGLTAQVIFDLDGIENISLRGSEEGIFSIQIGIPLRYVDGKTRWVAAGNPLTVEVLPKSALAKKTEADVGLIAMAEEYEPLPGSKMDLPSNEETFISVRRLGKGVSTSYFAVIRNSDIEHQSIEAVEYSVRSDNP